MRKVLYEIEYDETNSTATDFLNHVLDLLRMTPTFEVTKLPPSDPDQPLPELEPLDWNKIGEPFYTTTCFRVLHDKVNSLIAHVKKLEAEK